MYEIISSTVELQQSFLYWR